jgi:uncharacterized protein
MTPEEKLHLAKTFLSVLSKPNEELVRSIVLEDMLWTFPGSSVISGEAHGVSGVMKRATTIASYGVHVEVGRPVYGHSGVAVFLHNTGSKYGRTLDEQLAAVFSFRDDKIARLDTFLSDVPMVKEFFG